MSVSMGLKTLVGKELGIVADEKFALFLSSLLGFLLEYLSVEEILGAIKKIRRLRFYVKDDKGEDANE